MCAFPHTLGSPQENLIFFFISVLCAQVMMRKESVLANLEKVEEVASLAVNKMAEAQGKRSIYFYFLDNLEKKLFASLSFLHILYTTVYFISLKITSCISKA